MFVIRVSVEDQEELLRLRTELEEAKLAFGRKADEVRESLSAGYDKSRFSDGYDYLVVETK
jgi:hypothetical protein